MSSRSKHAPTWEVLTKRKREEILNSIPPHWRLSEQELQQLKCYQNVCTILPTFLSPMERAITSLPTADLLSAIGVGDYTASEVTSAFSHRATLAHQLTNCLCEIDLTSATAQAQELDAYWREHRKPCGPLHGLPVSLMDRFNIAGMDSTCGFASWIGKPKTANDEGVLVRHLRKMGAVIYCKTNVPMGALMGETINNIIGFTVNPYNTSLSAGGASGGEGALLALGGSAVGIATDLVGSSRIPAAFSGLAALRTSEGRLSATGIETILRGLPVAPGTIGLMAKDLKSIDMVFRALLECAPWHQDHNVIEMPWRTEKDSDITRRAGVPGSTPGRLVFGMMNCDGNVRPTLPIKRALTHVRHVLKQNGHEVVDWNPPRHDTAVENLLKIFGSASGPAILEAVRASGEPPVGAMQALYDQQDVACNSTSEFWDMCQEREDYRQAYANYWTQLGSQTASKRPVDGIILPVSPTTAVREGEFRYFAYSAIANLMDYPSAVFPVVMEEDEDDSEEVANSEKPLSELDSLVQKSFREEDAKGVPVCLQVMCTRLQEERVLALAQVIDETIRAHAESA